MDALKFPDYDWNLEPLDRENRELLEERARGQWSLRRHKQEAAKKRYFSGDSVKSFS